MKLGSGNLATMQAETRVNAEQVPEKEWYVSRPARIRLFVSPTHTFFEIPMKRP